jgi:hypothetical protein
MRDQEPPSLPLAAFPHFDFIRVAVDMLYPRSQTQSYPNVINKAERRI